MRIVLASSEAVPYSKTGGLGDVSSALPKALAQAGHQVWLFLPLYDSVYKKRGITDVQDLGWELSIPLGPRQQTARVFWSMMPDSQVTVIHIEQPQYFDRADLYQENGQAYPDNSERYIFFSRAVMEICRQMLIRPDVIHVNDWQTGLIPALLDVEYRQLPEFADTASVITIHNLAFQGNFWHWDMLQTGLDWKYFNWEQMEAYGQLNLLKTGIVFADKLTTVSPQYAQEIQTEEFGCGLHPVLSSRANDLSGILNGIDQDVWDPDTDPHIPHHFNATNFSTGKAENKRSLQQQVGLPDRNDVPVFGMVTRMTGQKGLDLIRDIADEILKHDVQLVFLGTGDDQYEQFLTELSQRYRDKVSTTIGFHEEFAHLIEAGSDLYLMPSSFEPCGLNQMYSMRYGTVPIVHAVGGLADSVIHAKRKKITAGNATGFVFGEYRSDLLLETIEKAIKTYQEKPLWKKLVQNCMDKNWSWSRSAAGYLDVYQQAIDAVKKRPKKEPSTKQKPTNA